MSKPRPKSKHVHRPRPPRHDLVDAVVLEVHGLVHDQRWLADRALERALRREKQLWANERREVAEGVYGLLRTQGQLDWLLFGTMPGDDEKPRADHLSLRYAAWLVTHAGVRKTDAALRLAVPAGALDALDGAAERIAKLSDPVDRLAVEGSLPRWIAQRFVAERGLEEARRIALAMNERAPLTVRANTLRTTREALLERLFTEGTEAEPTRFSPWGLVLDGHQNAFALDSFQDGLFEIQDEGSQLIALAVGARPHHVVVDACAGAGGKSLALSAEMHNKGSLQALDSDDGRLHEARRRASRAHADNIRTRVVAPGPEAAAQLEDFVGKADEVLVDAPCSGLGTLRRKPDARWRLRPEEPAKFAAIQRELLGRYATLAKPGGRIVYATCALGRMENQEVSAYAVAELGLEPTPLAKTLGAERAVALGVVGDGHEVELLPHVHGTDGFFFASYTRKK